MEGDKIIQLIGLLFILVSTCCGQLSVRVNNEQVKQGDNIMLTCRVEMYVSGNVINWNRIYQKDNDDMKEIVSNNVYLTKGYKGISRYSVGIITVDKEASTYDVQLNITGAQLEDTGTFSCTYKDMFEERIHVDVLEEPQTITLTMDDEVIEDGAEYEMDAGDIHSFKCTVGGSNPAPNAVITIDRKTGAQAMDITDLFEAKSMVSYISEISNDNEPPVSLIPPSGTTVLVANDLPIKAEYGNKFFTCTGSVDGGEVTLTKKLYIRFKGTPPEFDCNKTIVSYKGVENVEIKCTVSANPALDTHSITFNEGHENATITLNNRMSSYGHYVYRFEREKYSDKYFMILQIDRLYPQMFREYHFKAENEYGKVEAVVELQRDKSLETTSGATMTTLSSVAVILTTLFSFL